MHNLELTVLVITGQNINLLSTHIHSYSMCTLMYFYIGMMLGKGSASEPG